MEDTNPRKILGTPRALQGSNRLCFLGNPRAKRATALPARVFDSGADSLASARSLEVLGITRDFLELLDVCEAV